MEDGEVKSKTKSDRMAWVQSLAVVVGLVVVFESTILEFFKSITFSAFSNVPVVVSDHFLEKCLSLIGGSNFEAFVFTNRNNCLALRCELSLDFGFVRSQSIVELGIFWVLFDCANSPDGSSLGPNLVFEADREQVSFFGGEVFRLALNN